MYYYQTIHFLVLRSIHCVKNSSQGFGTRDICDTCTLNGFRSRADDGPILVVLPELNPP